MWTKLWLCPSAWQWRWRWQRWPLFASFGSSAFFTSLPQMDWKSQSWEWPKLGGLLLSSVRLIECSYTIVKNVIEDSHSQMNQLWIISSTSVGTLAMAHACSLTCLPATEHGERKYSFSINSLEHAELFTYWRHLFQATNYRMVTRFCKFTQLKAHIFLLESNLW